MTAGRPALPRVDAAEAAAAVADLGVLLPILAALTLVNGVDPVASLLVAGCLFLAAGLAYRVPVPVQPIKAAAAIAIAARSPPEVVAAAGLLLGAVFVLLALTGAIRAVARLFPKPIIRGNQLGVGILLVLAAGRLASDGASPPAGGLAVLACATAVLVAATRRRGLVAAGLVAGGVLYTLLSGGAAVDLSGGFALPAAAWPSWHQMAVALPLLVIPQLPLTIGNAIVGTADLEREYYGAAAARVTPRRLSLSCGLGNLAAGALGGMPVCHGSSGATAYYRFGARTGGVNLMLGSALIAAAVVFGRAAPGVFALIPLPVLGALLAYAGLRHGLLVADLRGGDLAVALTMGAVGGVTRNLTWAMAVGLPLAALVAVARRARRGRVSRRASVSSAAPRLPAATVPAALLVDGFGRVADDLRVSVVDRCNFRCTYCMPAEGLPWLPRSELLTYEEIARVVRVLAGVGVRTVRLTGGEPLVRRDLSSLVGMLSALAVPDVSLTTNGFLLKEQAGGLAAAGLRRVNVSVDSLLRHRFAEMTRRDALERVLEGLRAADDAGMRPIKLNCVVVRGTNDVEVIDFARFARRTGYEVRFIEYMPLDADERWSAAQVVPSREVLETIASAYPLVPRDHGPEPARVYEFADGAPGAVGVIASVTEPFCGSCNRIRVTSDGQFRTCLFATEETDVRALLRGGASDDDIADAVRTAVAGKWAGHSIGAEGFVRPARSMSMIGG